MKIPLRDLITAEETGYRPRGYVKEVLSRAKVVNGELEISESDFNELAAKYRQPRLGDRVEHILKPIAAFLDKHFGTNLAKCSACLRRKAWLNRWF